MAEETGTIVVGCADATVVVHVRGVGNLFNSYPLQAFLGTMLEESAGDFVFDLESCTHMDSTFMGVIAGLAQRLQRAGKPRAQVVHASSPALGLMKRVGLTHLVDLAERDIPPLEAPVILESAELTKLDRGRHMLYAHLQLSDLSARNREQFAILIKTLKNNVARHERGS